MNNIVIKGTITTVGPLSISMPDTIDFGGFPVMTRGIDEEGQLKKTGYLPATTLRGFLRRAVVTHEMREAAENGQHYSLQKAYSELIGQDSQSEQQAGDIDLLEIKKMRDESPVVDLFGSGLGVASRLRVSHFLPEKNLLPEKFMGVRKDLEDTEGVIDTLSDHDAKQYYGREQANSRRAQAMQNVTKLKREIGSAARKGEDADELKQQLVEADKIAGKYKLEMGDMAVSSRTIVSHYALPVELPMHGKLVILNAKDRDLDMLEFGLNCLSREPVLGAQSARGCGEVRGTFDVLIDGKLIKKMEIGGYSDAKIDVF